MAAGTEQGIAPATPPGSDLSGTDMSQRIAQLRLLLVSPDAKTVSIFSSSRWLCPAERRQVGPRPIRLEDLLPPDHRARFARASAERPDPSALHGAVKAAEGRPGHPPAGSPSR